LQADLSTGVAIPSLIAGMGKVNVLLEHNKEDNLSKFLGAYFLFHPNWGERGLDSKKDL